LGISQFCTSHLLALAKDLLSSLLMQSSFRAAPPNGSAGDGSARANPQGMVLLAKVIPLLQSFFITGKVMRSPLHSRTVRKGQNKPHYQALFCLDNFSWPVVLTEHPLPETMQLGMINRLMGKSENRSRGKQTCKGGKVWELTRTLLISGTPAKKAQLHQTLNRVPIARGS